MNQRHDREKFQRVLRAISITVITFALSLLSDELDTFESSETFKKSNAPRLRDIVVLLDSYLAALKASD